MHMNTFTPVTAVRFRRVQHYQLAGQTLVVLCYHTRTRKCATNATHAYAAYLKKEKNKNKQQMCVCLR